jgi:hypothetical protein
MINYDRMFIKSISMELKPLYCLLEGGVKFEWDDEAENAFINVKKNWSGELNLLIPDTNGNFELETDASDIGFGAVLRQDSKPVSYISRCLTKAEKNYGITEKKVLVAL